MNPTKIKLIPHDGGPCPVDGACFLKLRSGKIIFATGCNVGNRMYPLGGGYGYYWSTLFGIEQGDDIIAYCPIEIKEGLDV